MSKAEPKPAAPFEESPGFILWKIALEWQRQQREALEKLELTHAQYILLAAAAHLAEAGATVTQRRVADLARTDPMTTSSTLRGLEKRGLVARAAVTGDARARGISLTKAGEKAFQRAQPVVEKTDEKFFGKLGWREPVFRTALAALAEAKP